jgi:HPt (histidine-containing phosphotransfer) domain-containing protein
MTLQELYSKIGGDYEQATRVLRMEKLIDKHIRKLTKNGVIDALMAAGDAMDPTELFETSHAVKGVCSNLGLTSIANLASQISEEYRPGNSRTMTDDEVKGILTEIKELYQKTIDGIAEYEAG